MPGRNLTRDEARERARLITVDDYRVELDLSGAKREDAATFRGTGSVVWGARTLRGSDALADDYKYVPVRRLALYLEETLYRSTQWVVFEPNDAPLWAQIRASIGAFLQDLFRRGAFQGATPREAFFVRCDADTTTQYDIDKGVVNILVGFAPLKPAEFVVISIQQLTASASA